MKHTKKHRIWDTIIVGAGAAGMAAAIACKNQGQKVLLIDKQSQMGRKILVTGNGKCNITNTKMNEACFYGNKNFIKKKGKKNAEFNHT